jgi:uncharacterized protein YkwD
MRFLLLGLLVVACDSTAPIDPGDCEAPAAAACVIEAGLGIPFEATASTAGGTSSHDPGCVEARGVADVAFQWTAPRAGRFDISTAGSAFDTVLSVRRGCGGEEIACVDDVGMARQAFATVELAACETIVILVDGFSPDESGAVSISITGRESVCDDGLDDDGDGRVDCDDTDDCHTQACIDDGSWPEEWSAFEWSVLEETNRSRAAGADCGPEGSFGPAPALEMDEIIRVASRLHSDDMATQNYFEHTSLDGRQFGDRMTDAGFTGGAPWGENIAAGSATPEDVVRGWMGSPGHCANIMSPQFRVIGIGYAFDGGSTFGHYWTQNFAASH